MGVWDWLVTHLVARSIGREEERFSGMLKKAVLAFFNAGSRKGRFSAPLQNQSPAVIDFGGTSLCCTNP